MGIGVIGTNLKNAHNLVVVVERSDNVVIAIVQHRCIMVINAQARTKNFSVVTKTNYVKVKSYFR